LQGISETLNQMLARIDTAFGSVRAFTANASHELRTPLSLIRTRVEIALCFPRSAEYYKTTLEQVQATTVHMTALLESLLTLARADANAEAISMAPVPLDLLVMEAADHWRPLAQRQGLTLSIVGNGAPGWVMGDVTALRRCAAILMENACRYTESGTIEIGLESEQGFITLLVKDTGIGIAPQHMPHLFERFYRGNVVRRANGFGAGEPHRAKNGSGLGLSLAKWIADQHHAELLVESRLGAGSCFRLRLPACATTAHAAATNETKVLRALE
jgi:signal transduction histidine kinase